jgi:hypothetical protein
MALSVKTASMRANISITISRNTTSTAFLPNPLTHQQVARYVNAGQFLAMTLMERAAVSIQFKQRTSIGARQKVLFSAAFSILQA